MLVDRVLVVGDHQTEDIEIILFVRSQRGAVEQGVDDRDSPPVFVIGADRMRGKRAE
jgi:hypothetical protein